MKGWVALAIAVLAAIAAIAWMANRTPNTGNEIGAKSACHTFVENRLKSPGSAKIGGELVTGPGPVWTVEGDVDSQNSFGGLVRNHFTCRADYADGTRWLLVDLNMTGN